MSNTIMIPIPAPPEGWVFDAIRTVKRGEYYFHNGEWRYNNTVETILTYPVAIPIPPKWTPPPVWGELFGDCWILLDANGDTWLSKSKLQDHPNHQGRAIADGSCVRINGLVNGFIRPEMMPPLQEGAWKIEAPK